MVQWASQHLPASEMVFTYLFGEIALGPSDLLESSLVTPSGAQLSSWDLPSPPSGNSSCFYLVLGFCFLYVCGVKGVTLEGSWNSAQLFRTCTSELLHPRGKGVEVLTLQLPSVID